MLLKNEARGDDMADIMAHLHQYVPTVDYAEDNTLSKYQPSDTVQFHRILMGGDQMTAARARSSKKHMANHPKPAGRLEGLEPMVEDWHTKASLLGVSLFLQNRFKFLILFLLLLFTGVLEALILG